MLKRKLFWGFLIFLLFFSAAFCLKPLFFPKPLVVPDLLPFPILRPSPQPLQTTLVAVGDIMLGRMVNVKMQEKKDFQYPFLKTAELLALADLTFGNLESAIVKNCPTTETGMVFCARPESIKGLKFAGFDVLSIANNHILNYGQDGRKQTIELLKQNSILFSDSNKVTVFAEGLRFGFLSFDLTANNNSKPVLEKVKENLSLVDILVVSLHWGVEYAQQPLSWQKQLAHQIIDAGAKVIIGHHPHVIQPTEKYKKGLIFYSLGNFVFDQPWSEETKKGKIAKIVFEDKEIKSFAEIPVYIIDYCQPQIKQN
ncbi:MAG TPA: CapA family protein [Clostridia bacterium]|nr:CapA family protein [Clostridia bacterium]